MYGGTPRWGLRVECLVQDELVYEWTVHCVEPLETALPVVWIVEEVYHALRPHKETREKVEWSKRIALSLGFLR